MSDAAFFACRASMPAGALALAISTLRAIVARFMRHRLTATPCRALRIRYSAAGRLYVAAFTCRSADGRLRDTGR